MILICCATAGIFCSRIALLGMKMIRHGINSGLIIRKASCRRRLARFLRTALLSNLREQITPHFGTGSKSDEPGPAYIMTVKKLTCFRPCSRTSANSDFRVSLPLFFEDCFNAELSVNLFTGRGCLFRLNSVQKRNLVPESDQCKSFSAFGATVFQDRAATAGCHSGAKSALMCSFDFRRLIRSFHCKYPFSGTIPDYVLIILQNQ